MNKTQLVNKIAILRNESHKDVDKFLNLIIDQITTEVANGGEVKLSNFIKFSSSLSAARKAINPSTGVKINVPACVKFKVKVSKKLKSILNPITAPIAPIIA